MLLQCESEGHGDAPTTGWLRAGTLESLVELNELCLGLIAEQAAAHGATGSALLRQVAELWCELDAPARRRAAACPYLLLDAGFADTARWRAAAAPRVGDTAGGYAAFFTVPAAAEACAAGVHLRLAPRPLAGGGGATAARHAAGRARW